MSKVVPSTEEATVPSPFTEILRHRKALEQCVRVVKMWHGDRDFDIYFNHSPEMKLIRDVLGKMPDEE